MKLTKNIEIFELSYNIVESKRGDFLDRNFMESAIKIFNSQVGLNSNFIWVTQNMHA